jgi:hypothetical protein
MAKCFKCNAKINYLHAYTENKYTFELGDDGKEVYNPMHEIDYPHCFECPECSEILFEGNNCISEATEFLEGKKVEVVA